MTGRRWLPAVVGAVGLCCCQRAPEWYAPPAQYAMPAGLEPQVPLPRFRPLLYMQDPDVEARIVSGVAPAEEGDDWRQTYEKAKFRLALERNANLEFFLRFALYDEQFAATGPLTVTVSVNGRVLARPRFEKTGVQEYAVPAPAGMLPASGAVDVELDVDPFWQRGTARYGLWLQALGFRARTR